MLALALSVALLNVQDPPRQRTICKNGTVILVERMADEPAISIQLWASAQSVPETKSTHGFRHLLEHLAARGSGDLDSRLEQQGCYMTARTFRDAMQIEVNVGPRQLDLGISALLEVIKPLQTSQASIDREVGVLRQEFATYDDASKLSSAGWIGAYGDFGLDPFGNLETLSKATPDVLRELHRKHFYPENLAIVISGPVDIKAASEKAVASFGIKQGGIRVLGEPLPPGKSGRVEVEGFGEGRSAITPGYDHPRTVGALSFALAVASGMKGAFVTYTPSVARGLVTVGQTERTSGMGLRIDAIGDDEWPRLFAVGKILARRWIDLYLRSASGVAYLRGLLLCQNPAARPELMLEAVDVLTFGQFKEAATLFSKEKGVTVVGA